MSGRIYDDRQYHDSLIFRLTRLFRILGFGVVDRPWRSDAIAGKKHPGATPPATSGSEARPAAISNAGTMITAHAAVAADSVGCNDIVCSQQVAKLFRLRQLQ